jgi:hypothetical protein
MLLGNLLGKHLRSVRNANDQNLDYQGPVCGSIVKTRGRTLGSPAKKAIYLIN